MKNEEYIEHEVKLRVHDTLFNHLDYKLSSIEKRIDKLEGKFNWSFALILTGIIIPIILKHYGF